MKSVILFLVCCFLLSCASRYQAQQQGVNDELVLGQGESRDRKYPKLLSEYRFFKDSIASVPNDRVTAYKLNSSLFSDYAEKSRFVYMPRNTAANWQTDGAVFDFPIGTALIKHFAYPGVGLIETRLLLKRQDGWLALPYVWNADHSDAVLKRAGKRLPVTRIGANGEKQVISYSVPNQNQCKTCHGLNDVLTPIGPKARNLDDGQQLQSWLEKSLITGLPNNAQSLADWQSNGASLDSRARAYLDINCSHCHNPQGSASNSGLFLTVDEQDPVAVGFNKRPVAAGRGSGGREFDIAPGSAAKSIMIHRMNSIEPGVAMPELGRGLVHKEGVALIEQWIDSTKQQEH